jgi:hypothetical protein
MYNCTFSTVGVWRGVPNCIARLTGQIVQIGKPKKFSMYCIQYCFICRPSDSSVSKDDGIGRRTVATLALAAYLLSNKVQGYNNLLLYCVWPPIKTEFMTKIEPLRALNLSTIFSEKKYCVREKKLQHMC